MKINTGELIKTLRQNTLEGDGTLSPNHAHATPRGAAIARWVADHFASISRLVPPLLDVVSLTHRVIGSFSMGAIAYGVHKPSNNYIPLWNEYMPRGAGPVVVPPPPALAADAKQKRVVYVPSCVTRMMGPARGDEAAGDEAAHAKFMVAALQGRVRSCGARGPRRHMLRHDHGIARLPRRRRLAVGGARGSASRGLRARPAADRVRHFAVSAADERED